MVKQRKYEKTEKEALSSKQLSEIERTARTLGGDIYKSFLLFRYTGMHPSVIGTYDYIKGDRFNERKLTEGLDDKGRTTIQWYRPKKEGGWAFTSILKHSKIDFNVSQYAKEVNNRSSKYKKSRNWFWQCMRDLGSECGMPDLSPLSFRHTLAVELKRLRVHETDICDILNISKATLRKYGKRVTEERNDVLEEVWGLE